MRLFRIRLEDSDLITSNARSNFPDDAVVVGITSREMIRYSDQAPVLQAQAYLEHTIFFTSKMLEELENRKEST